MEEKRQKNSGFNVFMLVGLLLTFLWLCFAITYASISVDKVADLELNNLGDFVAGFIAPVTVIWLVLGYFLQIKELQNTVRELQQSVEAQNRQAASVEANADHVKRDVFLQLAGQIIEQLEATAIAFCHEYDQSWTEISRRAGSESNAMLVKRLSRFVDDNGVLMKAVLADRTNPRGAWLSAEISNYKAQYELLVTEADKADTSGTLKNFYEQSAYGEFYRAIENL